MYATIDSCYQGISLAIGYQKVKIALTKSGGCRSGRAVSAVLGRWSADNAAMGSNSDAEALVARRVQVRGLVQGVGFRAACLRHARGLGIAGWVRNRGDGSVEALLLGAPPVLDWMCAWLQDGVAGARVTGIEVEPAPLPDPAPDGFEVLPTR